MFLERRRPLPATSRTTRATPIGIPGWFNCEQRQLNDALVLAAAREAGRAAQVAALETALRTYAPDHGLLAETGWSNADGTPELRWHAIFDAPHDVIAIKHGFMPLRKPAHFMMGGSGGGTSGAGRDIHRGRTVRTVLGRLRSFAERN